MPQPTVGLQVVLSAWLEDLFRLVFRASGFKAKICCCALLLHCMNTALPLGGDRPRPTPAAERYRSAIKQAACYSLQRLLRGLLRAAGVHCVRRSALTSIK